MRLLFSFLLFLCLSTGLISYVFAQRGGIDESPSGCRVQWNGSLLQPAQGDFTGTGTSGTAIGGFTAGMNGWVNYAVEGLPSGGGNRPSYTLQLQLGSSSYEIEYTAPRILTGSFMGQTVQLPQDGSLVIQTSNNPPFSPLLNQTLSGNQLRTIFRIAREGNIVRFYQDDRFLAETTADMGAASVLVTIANNSQGRVRVTPSTPICQELTATFSSSEIDCLTPSPSSLSITQAGGGTSPYVYHANDYLSGGTNGSAQGSSLSSSSPTIGWFTVVDQDFRAATYYSGLGYTIDWQQNGTQLTGGVLNSSTIISSATPDNTLLSGEDGWMSFRKDDPTHWRAGFVEATTGSPLYEFAAGSNDQNCEILIGGVSAGFVQAFPTDYLRIAREGNKVRFYVNEVEVHSHNVSNTLELKSEFHFTQVGISLSDPVFSFCTPLAQPSIILASTHLSFCRGEDIPPITPTTENVSELRWYASNPDGASPALTPIHIGASFDPNDFLGSPFPTGTRDYYVTGLDLAGNETSSEQIRISVSALPEVSISSSTRYLCPSLSFIDLYSSIDPAGSYSYQWFKDGVLLSGETQSHLRVTQAGIYRLEATNSLGCIGSREHSIFSPNLPTLSLSSLNGSTGCGSLDLSVSISSGGQYRLERQQGGGWLNLGTYSTSVVSVNQSGTYRAVYAYHYSGCSAFSNTLSVTVPPSPTADLSSPVACQGEDIVLTIQNYNPSFTYQWQQNTGGSWLSLGTSQSITVPYTTGSTSASFRVITTHPSTGCSGENYRTVTYQSSPSVSYTSFVEAEPGDHITFNVLPNGSYTYSWTGPNGFISSQSNPSIPVTGNAYGEYVFTLSNGSCQATYRAILGQSGVFATLKEDLDASYYHTNQEGKLYFKFDEKYGLGANGAALVSIFNYDYIEVGQSSLSKEYGYNWYEMDLSSFGIEGHYYILHIKDERGRRYVLRVKYMSGEESLHIGSDVSTCIANSTELTSVSLSATGYASNKPYKIEWYTSTSSNQMQQLENLSSSQRESLLFASVENIEMEQSQVSFMTQQYYMNQNSIYAPSEGVYYVRAKMTNYCGVETYSEETLVITITLDPNCTPTGEGFISGNPERKHRFEFFFGIRRLFSPKPSTTTNPAVR